MTKSFFIGFLLTALCHSFKPQITHNSSSKISQLTKTWLFVGEYDTYRETIGQKGYLAVSDKKTVLCLREDKSYYNGDQAMKYDSTQGMWEFDEVNHELVFFPLDKKASSSKKGRRLYSYVVVELTDSCLQLEREHREGVVIDYYSVIK